MSHFAIAALLPVSFGLFACINTTYSRTDEVEITNDVRLLVIGAFAHHGDTFYEYEVDRCLKILKANPKDFAARNDLGAAFTKLGKFEQAEAAFIKNEELHPGEYKTASNLGVMFKKKGEYEAAARWIEKALRIKPGGHMGLGDYYLKMIQWRQANPSNDDAGGYNSVAVNFLGVRYSDGPEATAKVANREYVITLIKNDMNFPDAYAVLGDICLVEKDYQTALRCYRRAYVLHHPWYFSAERTDAIREAFSANEKEGYVLEEMDFGDDQLSKEFAAAAQWLESYQQLEAERLANGLPVDFAAMKGAMAEQETEKPKLLEAAYYPGEESVDRVDQTIRYIVAMIGGFLFACLLIIVAVLYAYFRAQPDSGSIHPKYK